MGNSLNRVELIGNVGRDPEVRTFGNGGKVANFTIALDESYKKEGEKIEKTEWVNITVFGDGLAGVVERYVKKGSKLYLNGSLATRKYEKDGQDRYVTEVVLRGPDAKMLMLDGAGGGGGSSSGRGGSDRGDGDGGNGSGRSSRGGGRGQYDLGGDDIPF